MPTPRPSRELQAGQLSPTPQRVPTPVSPAVFTSTMETTMLKSILAALMPNQDQIYAYIRTFVLAQGTVLISHGIFVTNSQLEMISGGLAAVAAIILSQIFHSTKGQSLLKE